MCRRLLATSNVSLLLIAIQLRMGLTEEAHIHFALFMSADPKANRSARYCTSFCDTGVVSFAIDDHFTFTVATIVQMRQRLCEGMID